MTPRHWWPGRPWRRHPEPVGEVTPLAARKRKPAGPAPVEGQADTELEAGPAPVEGQAEAELEAGPAPVE